LTYLPENQQAIPSIMHQFHQREKSMEDRFLAVMDTAAGQ